MNHDLNAVVRDIAAVIGREPALALAGKVVDWTRRGKRGRSGCVYVPRERIHDSRLARLVTAEEALKLRDAFGGEILKISLPTVPIRRFRDETIRRLHAEGWGVDRIANEIGVSSRRVRQVLAR